jgi:methyl-accepting chemotaxis protein
MCGKSERLSATPHDVEHLFRNRTVMEITTEQEQRLLQATQDFRTAMEIRNSMSVRVARRVTAILRIGMVSLGVVTVILLMMLYAFTSKMDDMITALDAMNEKFSSMSLDMTTMRSTLSGMERNIAHVPAITRATTDITTNVGEMRSGVDNMHETMGKLSNEVHAINSQVGNMSWQLRSLDPAIQNMGHDVNRMSGPMRMFNIFNPVP